MLSFYDLNKAALTHLLAGWGEPAYRAAQVWDWGYGQKVTDFDAMTNLPKPLRERLAAEIRLGGMAPLRELGSQDGETRKWLLQLADGQLVEAVGRHASPRRQVVRWGASFARPARWGLPAI
jgi:23S rRNA (adenine2503-C2)-methyltransferase